MKKILLVLAFCILPVTGMAAAPKDDIANGDLAMFDPQTLKAMLDVAIRKSEQHMDEIAVMYNQYMTVLHEYYDRQIAIFRNYLPDNTGQASKGYIPVKNVGDGSNI